MIDKYDKSDPLLNILIYAFMTITVLQCNSMYLYFPNPFINKVSINFLWQIGIVSLLLIYMHKHSANKINVSNFIMFIIVFTLTAGFIIVYNLILNPLFPKFYIVKFLMDPILCIILLCCIKNINRLFLIFENVVVVVAALSLPSLILYIIGMPTNTTIMSKWSSYQIDKGYFYLSFFSKSSSITFLGLPWTRNAGIFAEPSMFAYVITLAILIELFIRNNNKLINYRIILLFLTVITTASTTGILISIIAVIYDIVINYNKKGYIKFIFMLVLMLPLIFIFMKSVFIGKINTGANDSAIRFDDIHAGLETWVHHLILGCGFSNNGAIRRNMSSWRFLTMTSSNAGESAGLPTVLAQGGIFWGLFYILPTILVSKKSTKLLGLSLLPLIMLIFVTSQGFYIYIILLSYFWYIIINFNNIKQNELLI